MSICRLLFQSDSTIKKNISADGKHVRGRTRILADSARKRNRKEVCGSIINQELT
jgi:hypothetical protein